MPFDGHPKQREECLPYGYAQCGRCGAEYAPQDFNMMSPNQDSCTLCKPDLYEFESTHSQVDQQEKIT